MLDGERFLEEVFEDVLAREWLLPEGLADEAISEEMLEQAFAFQIASRVGDSQEVECARVLLAPQYEQEDYVLGYAYSELSRRWYCQMHAVDHDARWPIGGSYRFMMRKGDSRSVIVTCVSPEGMTVVARFQGVTGFVQCESAVCMPHLTGSYPKEAQSFSRMKAFCPYCSERQRDCTCIGSPWERCYGLDKPLETESFFKYRERMTSAAGWRLCVRQIIDAQGTLTSSTILMSSGHYGSVCPDITGLLQGCANSIRSSYFDPHIDRLLREIFSETSSLAVSDTAWDESSHLEMLNSSECLSEGFLSTIAPEANDSSVFVSKELEAATERCMLISEDRVDAVVGPSTRRRRQQAGVRKIIRSERRTPPKNFVCDQCQSRFSQASHLANHINTVHLKIRAFECPLCMKKFGLRSNLKRHYREIHPDEEFL
eukprot:CAMPEP_0184678740 /NCGR_PEP_ID=MMETSP0312-20130426/1537_1 /TAXON_ID=31354 /ORGANISM="Compsopogon coeruleus, Strain SAG 36.94" /LENGTH=428 /DNA_ID=CAMNT_0027127717 /DNA_START=180 /DNA_END=1466 /DNA_ORIENTATION=-